MTTKKSITPAVKSLNLAKNDFTVSFYPNFSAKLPIERDSAGIVLRGTAMMIFQGISERPISWVDKAGERQTKATKRFVFAVKSSTGNWQPIDIACTKWAPENLMDRTLKALGAEGYVTVDAEDGIDADLGFGEIIRFNFDVAEAQIEPLRGLLFLAEMKRFKTAKGGYLYQIEIESLKAVTGADGQPMRRLAIAETDPDAYSLTVQEQDEN